MGCNPISDMVVASSMNTSLKSTSLSLVLLNVERERHLEEVSAFLKLHKPDVFCAQELREQDVSHLEEILGAESYFVPMMRRRGVLEGIGIFSKLPIRTRNALYYVGIADHIPDHDSSSPEAKRNTENFVLALCDIEKNGTVFRISNTHFLWTPDGQPSDDQRTDMKALLAHLKGMGEFVLCGDFNAPRGGEMFAELSSRYSDNVPATYLSSLDPKLHRAGHLERMVDGIFTTPTYRVSNVELHSGISDHCAVTATIQKK